MGHDASWEILEPGHYVMWQGKYNGEEKFGWVARKDKGNKAYVYVRAEDSEKTFSKRMKVARLRYDANHAPVAMATTAASSVSNDRTEQQLRAHRSMHSLSSNSTIHGM